MAAKPVARPNTKHGGVKVNFWALASKRPVKSRSKSSKEADVVQPKITPAPAVEVKAAPNVDEELAKLLVENPGISGATLVNLLKAKGFAVIPPKTVEEHKAQAAEIEKQVKAQVEASSASSNAASLRAQESKAIRVRTLCQVSEMKESVVGESTLNATRFRVVLLTEGLGNGMDGFYYTRESLQSAVPIFEGKKIFANHPDAIEEKVLPERDVKDILGHFENVRLEQLSESDDRAVLVADAVVLPDDPYRWARALMRHAVDFSKKYPDKDFVGLSINANGFNTPMRTTEFIETARIPKGALPKIEKALQGGLDTIKVVSAFKDAVSCDLVTEAGAGGKFLEMLEREKKIMTENEAKAKENKEGKEHADEEEDKELIKKMLKKHMGDDVSEGDMESAMEAYEYMKKEGHKGEEAAKMACSGMKMAKHLAEKHKEAGDKEMHEAKEAKEKKESEAKESEGDVKESMRKLASRISTLETENVKQKGVIAGFETEKRKRDLEEYLDEKCSKSGLPRTVTKTFRESAKNAQSTKEIDNLLSVFMEGYKQRSAALSEGFPITSEKGATQSSGKTESGEGFGDCF